MSKVRVLVVDDEHFFRKLTTDLLESWGYQVIAASCGKDAINLVKEKSADILILDYVMADMDGLSALKEIRRMDDKIPVIMFTAHPDIRSIKDAEDLHVSAFVPKFNEYADMQVILKAQMEDIVKGLSF